MPFFAVVGFYEPGRYRFFGLLIPLYTRLKKKEGDDSVARGEILGYLNINPGAHYSNLKTELGYGNSKLSYNLGVLERENRIKSRTDGRLRRFYPRKFSIPEVEGELKRLLDILTEIPGLNQKQIAKIMQHSSNTVKKLLDALIEKGKIRYEMNGRVKQYSVTGQINPSHQNPITQEMVQGERG